MAIVKDREYRNTSLVLLPTETSKRLDTEYYIEGYATTFTRYLLYEYYGIKYYEEISPNALEGADVSDVILQYDHYGKVLARNRNNTLGIEADSKGLFIFADLSKSEAAKELYQEIKSGLIDRMSWAFTIEEENYYRDGENRVRRIEKIKKVYDVSAVSAPANEDTEISVRSFVQRSFETEQQELLGLQARKLQLQIKLLQEAK